MTRKSEVWKHIEKVTNRCRICGVVIATKNNTTNLWNHLGTHHSIFRKPNASEAETIDVDDPGISGGKNDVSPVYNLLDVNLIVSIGLLLVNI